MKKVMFIFFLTLSLISIKSKLLYCEDLSFIDPDVENYFETQYGYKQKENGSFKDSPISVINPNTSVTAPKEENKSVLNYNLSQKVNYDNLPIYYELKQSYSDGPISSYVLSLDNSIENKVLSYRAFEIIVEKNNYEKLKKNLPKYDFVYGGEEIDNKDKKNIKVFGWAPTDFLNIIARDANVKSISFSSKKDLIAPMKPISLVVKVPSNRNLNLFSKDFVSYINKFGFVYKDTNIFSRNSKNRFSLIEIKGNIPLDKIDLLLSSPFVFKVNSEI
jgi:hypothetical protein